MECIETLKLYVISVKKYVHIQRDYVHNFLVTRLLDAFISRCLLPALQKTRYELRGQADVVHDIPANVHRMIAMIGDCN